MGHAISVDYAIPVEISATLTGASSLACDTLAIPASKPLFDTSEFVGSVAKQVAVRVTANAICHLLLEVWTSICHLLLDVWTSVIAISGRLVWWAITAIIAWLFHDHN
jgi:hypothetical protein